MAKYFINTDLNGQVPWKFLKLHILFISLWIISFGVLLFRIDAHIINLYIPELYDFKWVIPLSLVLFLCILALYQKVHYNLFFLFYPLIILIWLIPKQILSKGKFYLFIFYLNFLYNKVVNLKRNLITFLAIVTMTLLLIHMDYTFIRVIAIIVFGTLFFRLIYNLVLSALSPVRIFGINIAKYFGPNPYKNSIGSNSLIDSIVNSKSEERISEEEQKKKTLKSLVTWFLSFNLMAGYLRNARIEPSYFISRFFQLSYFIVISIVFLTFLNYQLYQIDPNQFNVAEEPNLLAFIFYTVKNILLSNFYLIDPVGYFALTFEILTYLIIAIIIFLIGNSWITSSKLNIFNKNVQGLIELIDVQNLAIKTYVLDEYDIEISAAIREFGEIKMAINKLKGIIDKFFWATT